MRTVRPGRLGVVGYLGTIGYLFMIYLAEARSSILATAAG